MPDLNSDAVNPLPLSLTGDKVFIFLPVLYLPIAFSSAKCSLLARLLSGRTALRVALFCVRAPVLFLPAF
jgi:hypothetical protein